MRGFALVDDGDGVVRFGAGALDRIDMTTASGEKRTIVFNISKFFGKY